MDAEYDTMDGSLDEVLSSTTTGREGMDQKGWIHSPLKGEWTHLDGEGTHAEDLVPNPRASGLIALLYFLHDIFYLPCNLGTIIVVSLYFSYCSWESTAGTI
jgi:hypothetical protein